MSALTYTIERAAHTHGHKRIDTDLFTFSDGQTWEIVTEWTYTPGDGMKATTRTVTKRVNNTPTEANYEDFVLKLVTAAESQTSHTRQDTP